MRLKMNWLIVAGIASVAAGDVNLEFRTAQAHYFVGETVLVDLYAVSDDPGSNQALAAIEAIITWPSPSLELVGIAGGGEAALIFEGFSVLGSAGLNESDPPADGDGLYTALASLGTPALASPAGLRITTLEFLAVAPDPAAAFTIEETGGTPTRRTIVYSGTVPNLDITGTLTGTIVEITPFVCGPADVNQDGVLDFFDVQLFLQSFDDMEPLADFALPLGTFDFFDVLVFLQAFANGCS